MECHTKLVPVKGQGLVACACMLKQLHVQIQRNYFVPPPPGLTRVNYKLIKSTLLKLGKVGS